MPITLAAPRLRSSEARYNENVVKYGAGADLLVHEVAIARPELMSEAFIERIMPRHTTAREAGMVFWRTKPKLAAYTHLAFLASEKIAPATLDDLVAETRQTYGRIKRRQSRRRRRSSWCPRKVNRTCQPPRPPRRSLTRMKPSLVCLNGPSKISSKATR
jgi:hypothetical protein